LDYIRLRTEYDTAFDRLRRAHSELWSIRRQALPDRAAEAAARERFNQEMRTYHSRRDDLASYLLPKQSSNPRFATELEAGELSRQDQIRALAHRLWEQDGRPVGTPDEYWYRAEEMLRNKPCRAA